MRFGNMKRRIIVCLFTIIFLILSVCTKFTAFAQGEVIDISSPSAILMEASTGKVIYEKNPDEQRSPASITKIMTMLLIFEALEEGKIKLDDEVVTSAHAKSMGGSQVFLEEGEIQTVDTLIKCIAIASGNDAAVCMAEHVAGSEEAFVEQMNQKAHELGLEQAHFVDCCGLTNSDDHHVSARDVAIVSRELINRYPKVYDYTKIWMEDMTHVTRQGTKQFTLSSTNKLLKQYEWTTGLKTGSTQKAKYCFSATAQKNGISLIAVIMGASDFKIRFAEAKKLLEYGYQNINMYTDQKDSIKGTVTLLGGMIDEIDYCAKEDFNYLSVNGEDLSTISKRYDIPKTLDAPVNAGDVIGKVVYLLHDDEIGSVDLIAMQDAQKAMFFDYLIRTYKKMIF